MDNNVKYSPFVLNTAKDYDMTPYAVKKIYDKYGQDAKAYYEELENYIKERARRANACLDG